MSLVLNGENFEEEVLKYDGVVLVDFYADWCGPCKMMAPIIDAISEDASLNVKVGKVNIDEFQEIAEQFEIMSIPTMLIFNNGEIVKSFVGVTEKSAIEEAIKGL